MFPFIWWLGAEEPPAADVGQHGSGGDHLRRRVIMATASQSWSPLRLSPLFGLEAVTSDLTLDADPDILSWRSRGSDAQSIAANNSLGWLPNGWGSGKGTPRFSQALSGPFLSTASGTVVSWMAGEDVPFAVLMTVQTLVIADQVFCCWDDTSPGSSIITIRTDNAGGGRLRVVRTDASGSNVTVTGNLDIGTEHQRLGVSFSGNSVDLYVGNRLDVSQASDVGFMIPNRFRIGTGPGIDALTGYMPSFWVIPRHISSSEWAAYYDYSVKVWG